MKISAFIILGVICGGGMLVFYLKSDKPVKTAFKGMLSGAAALLLVNIFGTAFKVSLSVSLLNTVTALVLGIPGVSLLVLGKLLLV
ncbi:MAG: pro-sigmaK processing inhibitor BofA family protein [Oscillospiraceae bacterium]|jgi:hypothetical protein